MSETPENGNPENQAEDAASQQGNALPPVFINGQFIKDLSFESPHAPMIFRELAQQEVTPDMPVSVDVSAKQIENNIFEVGLTINVQVKHEDRVIFLVELVYGAVVTLNVPPEHAEVALLVETPRLIFPFARNIISAITQESGFPALNLQPMNFLEMYRQRRQGVEGGQPSPTVN